MSRLRAPVEGQTLLFFEDLDISRRIDIESRSNRPWHKRLGYPTELVGQVAVGAGALRPRDRP